MKTYLSDRTQSVIIGKSISEAKDLTTGVPQGSVLGPLFFLIYLLPLYQILKKHGILFHGYADDTQLYVKFNPKCAESLADAIRRLEACIDDIRAWMTANKLKLNDGKTEFLVIVSALFRKYTHLVNIRLRVGNATVVPSCTAKNLGVILDQDMTMRPRINQIARSAYHHLRCVGKIRRYLNKETCASVVQALVISRLDYANALLTGLPNVLLRKLQLVQNNAARLITRTGRRDHITPVLKELHWLPVHSRMVYKVLCLVFKSLNGKDSPKYITDMIQMYKPERHLRSGDNGTRLTVPRTRRCVGDRAFSVQAPNKWNELPPSAQMCNTLDSFKKTIKTILFKQNYNC